MTDIRILVETLAVQEVQGEWTARPLLDQLRKAIGGDIGSTMPGASSGAPIPLNVGAFELWEDITGQIASLFVAATELKPSTSPQVNLLAWFAVFSAATAREETVLAQHEVASERLEGWVARIRAHFAPPRVKELAGVACPNCGLLRAQWGSGAARTESSALSVQVTDGELVASCRNPVCHDVFGARSVWVGRHQIAELGRRSGQTIDMTAIDAALRPVEEVPYVEAVLRVVEDFDPRKPEHAALTGGTE